MDLKLKERKYSEYKTHMQKLADLKNALALLQWDQETYLPAKGAPIRGQQMATLSEQIHYSSTAPYLGTLLQELTEHDGLSDVEKKNISLSWEDFQKQKKYNPEFVRKLSEAVSRSFHSWIEAREENSFKHFEKDLDILVNLKREETAILGYSVHPYDALLNEFEKGSTISLLDKTFLAIRPSLLELLQKIRAKKQIDDEFLYQTYPFSLQWDFGIAIIRELGFDFEAGRQDLSEHPFTTSFNCHDVRITTRIDEQNFGQMTWSCIHETGHALYEQGLPESEYGLPSGEFASLGIHESQSRLWENNVGRSLDFWTHHYPRLQSVFPAQLGQVSLADFYKGINKIEPSLIRTAADELTYHFHVMIRYELEKLLISGELPVSDIPGYWNEQYKKYLGVQVKDDKHGCLQDIHWSHGSFGYFPTYSLGSFYAAQFFDAARKQLPVLPNEIKEGRTGTLLGWLRKNVHQLGRLYTSEELCLKISGEGLNTRFFLEYLLDKYRKIYDF
ncbi:MAG: carboxypeptidase M32 [Chitinophagales bacterium]